MIHNRSSSRIVKETRLQFITNQWSEKSIADQVKDVCTGGCRWIQLRLKNMDIEQWIETGTRVKNICDTYHATLIINDHVEFALRINADGVHVGKNDMDPGKARQLLGPDKIIGASANDLNKIIQLTEKGVDYVGLGPFRQTKTKDKLDPVLGLRGYQEIMQELKTRNISTPVFAIGGIRKEDADSLIRTGIQGIAISSLLSNAKNQQEMTKELLLHK